MEFHQLLKQTQPRALPLSPAPLPSRRPTPAPATCSGRPGKASTSGPKLEGGRSQAGRAGRGPKACCPPFPRRGSSVQAGRTPPLILEGSGCAARRHRPGPPSSGPRRTQPAVAPSAPDTPGTHRLSPLPGGRLAAQVSASVVAVFFPTRTRGQERRSS